MHGTLGTMVAPTLPLPGSTAGPTADPTTGSLAAGTPVGEEFLARARAAGTVLTAPVRDAIDRFVADPGPDGVLLLRALPVGAVPATPARPGDATTKDRTSEHSLLTIACRLGEPVGYVQEHGGGLVQDIVPERGNESRQTSTSSTVTLAWHTETAFHPHKPRYLLLLCLRGDPAAATQLCSVHRVLPHLAPRTIEVLRQPRFRTRPDQSFVAPGTTGRLGAPMPVLGGDDVRPTFTYDEDLMEGTDDDARAALDALRHVVHAQARTVVLEPGDLLVVDNDLVVHGRSPFGARFDGTDRWLQRTFVVTDLAPSAGERRGRIITTAF
jgi:L-asparagine oxygenase